MREFEGVADEVGDLPTFLKDHGHEVLNPALSDEDFDEAVRIAQAEFDQHHPDVVVGSSRGGAVAINIDSGDTPLVLLCPAWMKWGTATTVKEMTIILYPLPTMCYFRQMPDCQTQADLPCSNKEQK